MKNTPLSRRSNLVVQELDRELLIYDLSINKAYCLNQTAALVWQSCDGKNSITQIAYLISRKLKTPIDENFVWISLRELQKMELLEDGIQIPLVFGTTDRRQLVNLLGKTVVALPLIFAITAPLPIQAQSCAQINQSCISNSCCTTGAVCANSSCCIPAGVACTASSDCCDPNFFACGNGICVVKPDGGGCVLYDTPITQIDGSTVRAIDVFVGQELLCVNSFTGSLTAGRVEGIKEFFAPRIYSLTAENGESIQCSPEHPLINGFGDKWGKRAELFKVGDPLVVFDKKLNKAVEAKTISIEKIEVPQPVIIFNMDEEPHTFISGGVISHNGFKGDF